MLSQIQLPDRKSCMALKTTSRYNYNSFYVSRENDELE